jgi:hypothetical protein
MREEWSDKISRWLQQELPYYQAHFMNVAETRSLELVVATRTQSGTTGRSSGGPPAYHVFSVDRC